MPVGCIRDNDASQNIAFGLMSTNSMSALKMAGEEATESSQECYACGKDNASQAFCGACGSPLALHDYIAKQVKDQVNETIRDRDVLEMDSSIKVFQQAWGWIKLIIGIATGFLVI